MDAQGVTCTTNPQLIHNVYVHLKTPTSQIRFCSSSVDLGSSFLFCSMDNPTMYSLHISTNCWAYNTRKSKQFKSLTAGPTTLRTENGLNDRFKHLVFITKSVLVIQRENVNKPHACFWGPITENDTFYPSDTGIQNDWILKKIDPTKSLLIMDKI